MTCHGCAFDDAGRCRALPPAPRVDGNAADRASWPQHDSKGCGAYTATKAPEVYPDAPNPKRVRLSK